jgi:ABC-type anion transport system duplicated permease subunit
VWSNVRELGESVVQGLAKVGLVWSVVLLGAFFVVASAQGTYASQAVGDTVASVHDAAPTQLGLALALVVLAVATVVLTIGSLRDKPVTVVRYDTEAAAELAER